MSWDEARSSAAHPPKLGWAKRAAVAILRRLLRRLEIGALSITLPTGTEVQHVGGCPGPHARLLLHRWRSLSRVLTGGDVGFAEAYMRGDWSTPDLVALLECLQRNDKALQAAWQGSAVKRLANRLYHASRSNSRRGSRRNIAAHYDLGNEFYADWLDKGMNYSSALYTTPFLTLEEAQIAKLDRAISLLGIEPDVHVLEIGCGWGALAERLMEKYGVNVTGITLSRQQLAYAQSRLRKKALGGQSMLRLEDYRDTAGMFDAIVSIEMLEAAGEAYWPTFFAKVKSCLKPQGVAVLQVITIEEDRFADYRSRPDFIQQYIFPGGMLPTISRIKHHAQVAGLVVHAIDTFGDSYARTLSEWRKRYLRMKPPLSSPHIATDHFRRMWHYYLAYCEVGFRTGTLDVGLYQMKHR